jgi:hypothetical protein
LIGHSRGGELVANYSMAQPDGTFDTVIQLASTSDLTLSMIQTKKMFAFTKADKWLIWQRAAYEKSAEPKLIIELAGGNHTIGSLIKEKPGFVQEIAAFLKK